VTRMRKATYVIATIGLIGAIVAVVALRPAPRPPVVGQATRESSALDDAPPEVREFLARVFEYVPEAGAGVSGFEFHHWKMQEKPTHEAIGLKAVPGADPLAVIQRVMDVDAYRGKIAHVTACRSIRDPAYVPPKKVRFMQEVGVLGIARVQQELVLVDAGTIKGYRVAYWYLLKKETEGLDPKVAARSEFNVGAWFAAPGAVGYALSTWPRREDVNALQWASLTSGADVVARKVIEGNIDGMAAWAEARGGEVGTTSR